jgi:hypothetical protein
MADTNMEKDRGAMIMPKRTASIGRIEKEIESC